jgi:uncharacterized protein YjgD (DUF1641 family)
MTTENARLSRRNREKEEARRGQLDTYEYSQRRLSELIVALDKRGLLEAAAGALEDEETFSGLMKVFSSDETLTVVQNAKPIIKLLSTLNYSSLNDLAIAIDKEKQAVAGAISLLRLVSALESRGLIQPLVGLLNDEKTFSDLVKLLTSDSSLLIISNLQNLAKLSNALDPEFLNALNKSLGSLKKEVKPVKGIRGLLHELGDPAVAAGMGRVFEILRILGEDALKKK